MHRFTVGSAVGWIASEGERTVSLQKAFNVPDDEMQTVQARWHGLLEDSSFGRNILLVEIADRRVLVDSGRGAAAGDAALIHQLQRAGIAPDSITDLILTHGHWDHLSGVTDADGRLLYPNAQPWMSRIEWDDWRDDSRLAARDDTNRTTAQRVLSAIADRVTLIEGERELFPGVVVMPAPGHTLGQIAVWFESDGARLVSLADALHQPVQVVCPHWSPALDQDPTLSPQTRRALLRRCAETGALVTAAHFPAPALGRVSVEGDGFTWEGLHG